ncbi:MAG: tRNA (N(6)-L-threonylcarbamoyladenosine(37)-C(2))-methylthiotransferase [Candidatus Bathyarchaeota archaeon]|nr:tRNA (N(6)-L-threonylcarbamoyladenosine(37)-C(2))-methylthiotransferase [Candidatus Bathyarchaeota archaeon]
MVWRVFIRNFGCSSNTADGETLAGCLTRAGFELVASEEQADVVIYNTCAVKGPTENRMINTLKLAPENKKILVAGCLPKISFERLLREVRFDGAVGPALGNGIVDVVKRVLAGERVVYLGAMEQKPLLSLPTKRSNPVVSIVPVNYGCLGSCAYCCVVHARGHLRSYSIQEVIGRVQADFVGGAKEFWVTSQDTGSYGRDLGMDLAELLFALGSLQGDFRVRVGMMTPNLVIGMLERLIDAFDCEKIFKFLHLPVQSGDDLVLQRMRRFYTSRQFKAIVDAFRLRFPDLTLATDVIVGFPGETDEAFKNTLVLLGEVKPDVVNVSKFFARPKTAAWEMQDGLVEKEEIKRRSTLAAELVKRLSAEKNLRWVGWSGQVLVDEKGKVEGSWVGRNFAYKPIVIKSAQNLHGKTVDVRVTEAHGTYLSGEIV